MTHGPRGSGQLSLLGDLGESRGKGCRHPWALACSAPWRRVGLHRSLERDEQQARLFLLHTRGRNASSSPAEALPALSRRRALPPTRCGDQETTPRESAVYAVYGSEPQWLRVSLAFGESWAASCAPALPPRWLPLLPSAPRRWLSIHLPVGPGWAGERSSRCPRFGRSFKGHRPQGADAEAAAPGRAGGCPPLPGGPRLRPPQRAPPGGSRGPKLIRLLRTGQGRKHREVLLPPAAPRPPTHTHPESEHKEKHFAD